MAATFDGRIMTCYVARKRGGVIGEWREITKFSSNKVRGKASTGPARTSDTRHNVKLPRAFARAVGRANSEGSYKAGRFTLECYLGRRLESWEVCRHGTGGPNDHSYLNVSPGDAVNNHIDDLENGKTHTNLTYMIQAQNRISRIISNLAE